MGGRVLIGLRAGLFLLGGFLLAIVALLTLAGLLVTGVLSLVVVGLPWFAEALRGLRGLAGVERRRAGRFLGVAIPSGYRASRGGSWRQVRTALGDAATWRDLLWLFTHLVAATALFTVAFVCWAAFVVSAFIPLIYGLSDPDSHTEMSGLVIDSWPTAIAVPALHLVVAGAIIGWGLPWLARAHAHLARLLLRPTKSGELAARVQELATTRAAALDAHAAELRRIERDLHDGAQARLVSIAMRLGLAERRLPTEPEEAQELVRDARLGAEEAIAELRSVVRSIYPPILSDRGLAGALTALASACPVATHVRVGELGSLPAAVEAAAYFTVAEALTNVAKHSGASEAQVVAERERDTLVIEVHDDGAGGAAPDEGTGLPGIERRVAAHDGRTTLTSPAGGPTIVRVELPCGS